MSASDSDLDMRTRLAFPGMLARRLREIATSLHRINLLDCRHQLTFAEVDTIVSQAAGDLDAIARLLNRE